MFNFALPRQTGLWSHSRFPALGSEHCRQSASAFAALLLFGALAAVATELIDFKLKLPGHAILRSILPMSLGLALVPRRGAGLVMGGGVLCTSGLLRVFGFGGGIGSLVSVAMIGPALELSLWRAERGWRVYLGFMLAGLLANLSAFAAQVTAKSLGIEGGSGKPLAVWLPTAMMTYPIFGLAAGALSAMLWFRLKPKNNADRSS